MAGRTPREAGGGAGAADDALDRLYGEPLDDFVRRRKELAAALRAAGDVAASRLVMKAAKPSRTAWALNQVARRRPELVRAAFDARAKAVDAQTSGEGEALRATARAYRERLASLVDAAGDAVREDGGELTVAQGRRISATVQAVAGADDGGMREALLAGRFVADVDVDDPFAGLEPGPARERAQISPPRDDLAARRKVAEAGRVHDREHDPQARPRELEKQAREREKQARQRELEKRAGDVEKARAQVAALEDEAREARAAAREAEVAAGRAQVEAQRLRRAVEAVERRLGEARGDLRKLAT
jgi:hypothetical protein